MTSNDPHRDVEKARNEAENRDPLTGAPGAHPVATGVGATAGGVAGAAIGAIGGPVGVAVGAAAGAVAGGLIGKAAGEAIDPTEEATYWRSNFTTRPYAKPGARFEDYEPAYRYGWESWTARGGRGTQERFEDVERELGEGWLRTRGDSVLAWSEARDAARDAWRRLEARAPAKADRQAEVKQTVDTLNSLIGVCRDGSQGFRSAAEKASNAYATMFSQFAAERDAFADQLAHEVLGLGGDPEHGGTVSGAVHRAWLNVRSMAGGDDKTLIEECERGEDHAAAAYRGALAAPGLTPGAAQLLGRQYERVRTAHDRIASIKRLMP